jgi:protein CpxP
MQTDVSQGDLMFKQRLLILIAAGVIATATFAVAQDSPPAPPQGNDQQGAPPMAGNGGWQHHGPPDPAQRTQELTKRLKLTSDQQTKVQDILVAEKSQMESMHQDTSTPQQDRRAKMMDLRKSTDTQIRAVLDSTQQKKWDEMQARREERMQNHRGGPPDAAAGQQSPPTQ